MYTVDKRDRVVALAGIPQSSVGAPCPMLLANEHTAMVAFYCEETPIEWDGRTARSIDPTTSDEPYAVVSFGRCRAKMFGPPNDEAFAGHPLADRGLQPYGAFEVLESSWIRDLIKRNEVHPNHRPALYAEDRHLVLTFHDSVFECIARTIRVTTGRGPLSGALRDAVERLE